MEPTHLQYLEEILSSKYACDHLTGYQQETIDALAELLSYCPYERLCELAQADREKRIIVIPKDNNELLEKLKDLFFSDWAALEGMKNG